MRKILFLSFFIVSCGNEIYYLDSYNFSQSGESTYETKELTSSELNTASIEAYQLIADEIISVYSSALNKDNNLGGVSNEIKALEFLNQALFNFEIYTVNRELMKINVNKKYNFDNLSIEDIENLIKEKIQKEKDKLIQEWPDEEIRIEKARWGRSNIIKGKKKVELGKDVDPTKITLEVAMKYLKPKTSKKKK